MRNRYPRFEIFYKLIDAKNKASPRPGGAQSDTKRRFIAELVAAGLGDLAGPEVSKYLEAYLDVEQHQLAVMRELANLLNRHGAETLDEGMARMAPDDIRGKTALQDLDIFNRDLQEAQKRLGRKPGAVEVPTDLYAGEAGENPLVLVAALRAGMLE
jgi:hypothetical protein